MKTIELKTRTQTPNFGKIPQESNKRVLDLAAPHIDSFNFMLEEGLQLAVKNLPNVEFQLQNGDQISLMMQDVEIGKPNLGYEMGGSTATKVYPKEIIESKETYQAPLNGTLVWMVNGRVETPISFCMGAIPIMVKSKACNLYGLTPEELVKHGEIVNETGGYFIINGSCRILRLLIANRRNYPIALERNAWKQRDVNFSEKGILMRCITEDETSTLNVLHHLKTGGVKLEILVERELYLLPLILLMKALIDYSDRLIYVHLVRGRERDKYFVEKVKMMLRELQSKKLYNREICRDYIGSTFKYRLEKYLTMLASNEDNCALLLDKFVLPHLDSSKEKFDTLCMMTRKLFSFIAGECSAETTDVLSLQEASLGGYTYLQYLKYLLFETMKKVKYSLIAKNKDYGKEYVISYDDVKSGLKMANLGDTLKAFLGTGSLSSRVSIGLMQKTGLTVVMERLNRMRDLSHLRAIHRGSFFMEMKTLGPRKLTGEAWGFICPVHTPDGAPCGLLNHLSGDCVISNEPISFSPLKIALMNLGMTSVDIEPILPYDQCLEVIADGSHVGYITKNFANEFANKLRILKVTEKISKYTEIVLINHIEGERGGQYPALYLFSSPSRMMRPVINLELMTREYIGTFEQLNLNIAIAPEDIEEGVHTHMDIEKTSMLSNIGKLVPFSDCNPNPRNMYQCQMGKQTMGMPIHNWRSQTYNKLYRLQYPQLPLVRNAHYDKINMEEFCMGFNAVLAVVSYTGYDMEDAMIINKCAMERGLGHGQVYKTECIDMKTKYKGKVLNLFQRDPENPKLVEFLDENGLPYPGIKLKEGDPYYCIYSVDKNSYFVGKYKGEDCIVDKQAIVGKYGKDEVPQKATITLRVDRNPNIGDKFASRSGQKGIMSRLYPMEDLPFSERGITPDIIFNPHGIPSRMTAGTLIDLVAGKCAAEFGKSFDSTPFEFNDENPAFDYYGKILEKAGFNYYGEDILYSGTDGRMMEVEIFEGIVYYQRLRHMTADKWQVRSTGPRDVKTFQPIKGRKRGGAIRFGEMERDCLISHGAAYMLKDRLLDCSDYSESSICSRCGSIVSPNIKTCDTKQVKCYPECSVCGPDAEIRRVQMPYAFKYLIAELACIGIKTEIGTKTSQQLIESGSYPSVSIKKEPT